MLRKIVMMAAMTALVAGLVSAQTVDEIIAKNNAARGGLDRIKAVKSSRIVGKGFSQGMELPMAILWKRPNRVRMDMTIQGKVMVQAFDSANGWMIMPFMGSTDPEKMTAEDTKEISQRADFDGELVDYQKKGHKVELVGKEDVDGAPAYKLKVTLKNGDIEYVFIDAATNLELKSVSKRKSQGAEIEIETFSSDYKLVDSVLVPHAMESKVKGQTVMQLTFDTVKFNVPVADSAFVMPPKKAVDTTAKAPSDSAAVTPATKPSDKKVEGKKGKP